MTTVADAAGSAELWLISDFPIDESQLRLIRQLFGENTSDADIPLPRRSQMLPLAAARHL